MRAVIVGGGIVGTAIASRLGETDREVTLLERSRIGRETTAASAGIVMQTAVEPEPLELRLRERGRSVYRRLFEDDSLEWERTGALYVAETEAFAERLRRSAETLEDRGVEASYLPADDLERFGLEPGGFVGALHTPNDRVCDPTAVAEWFATCARRCGVDVRTGVSVTDVALGPDGSVSAVETTEGPLEADRVINATGPWAPILNERAGVSLPLCHTRGPMAALETDAPVESPVTILESKRYVRPTRGVDAAVPGECSSLASDDGSGDASGAWIGEYLTEYVEGQLYDPADLRTSREFAGSASDLADVVPALEGGSLVDEWIGLRTVTPDGLPLIGETNVDGYLVACGMTGQGVTIAPAVADVIARLLDGDLEDETRDRLAPERF
ncbi:NAD(P)/FAD-dependent oxidoreductase [Natrialbaceae archaeon GCM10025810]|uniref:NAD(P)/FAD-dependent oxidoreductase n=1 Tax=Halovalidus salilacus TaxID=3075124 RepID=UPI00361D68A1